jgi:16S rRNA (guanine527-N7)-methyltransferase
MPDSTKPLSLHYVSRETLNEAEFLFNQNQVTYSHLLDLWLRWNKSVNLFSKKTNKALLEKHLVHSLILSFVTNTPDCNLIVDAGTGGGLPGLPLAISNSKKEHILVDKVGKKCLAVRDIVRALEITNVRILHSDISAANISRTCRIVSKHAFPVRDLLKASKNINWVEIAMLKGDDVISEIDSCPDRSCSFSFHRFEGFEDPFFENRGVLLINRSISE